MVDGKTVLGSLKKIQEVHKTFAVYKTILKWHEASGDYLLEAHAIIMKGMLTDAGQCRNCSAFFYRGSITRISKKIYFFIGF